MDDRDCPRARAKRFSQRRLARSKWRYQRNFLLIVQDPKSNLVLLQNINEKWQLPCFEIHRPCAYGAVNKWAPEASQHFGWSIEIILLRCIWDNIYSKSDTLYMDKAILVMERYGETGAIPGDMQWMDPYFLSLNPSVRDAEDEVKQFQHEWKTGELPILRSRFSRRGWCVKAIAWMREELISHGFGNVLEVEQLAWSLHGTVFRAKLSDDKSVFLKATSDIVNEGYLHEVLSKIAPKYVLPPIAVDNDRRLVLMQDYGETCTALRSFKNEDLKALTEDIIHLQLCTVGKEALLKEAGVKVMTLSYIESELENLFSLCEKNGVDDAIVTKMRESSPQIRNECRQLEKLGLPTTLQHGDLYESNMCKPDGLGGPYRFFDWTFAFFSHPFLHCPWELFENYQEQWTQYLSENCGEGEETVSAEHIKECLDIGLRKLAALQRIMHEFLIIGDMERPKPEIRFLSSGLHVQMNRIANMYSSGKCLGCELGRHGA